MRTYDAWFPRYALGNGLMFFCRVFSPAVGRGSSALLTFLDRRTQRVNGYLVLPCIVIMSNHIFISRSEHMSSIFIDSFRLVDLLC